MRTLVQKSFAVAALLSLLAIAPARADQAAADACAAALPAQAKMIYDAALPGAAGGGKLADVVRASATSLVKSGQISRSDARGEAQAAGACLKKL